MDKRKQRENRKLHISHPYTTPAGTFQCFPVNDNNASFYQRSKYTPDKRKKVRIMRQKGACLRCRVLKKECSEGDPCDECLEAAKAASGSRALLWMTTDCNRSTLKTVNIFDNITTSLGRECIETVIKDLLDDDVHLDFQIPFAFNVAAASTYLADWLSNDDSPSTFSVAGLFSSSAHTNMIADHFTPSLSRNLRLFVHLTTYLYTTNTQGGYKQYTDDEIQAVRDIVGAKLLHALDKILPPSRLEASGDKLKRLQSLFLLLFGLIVGMGYTCPEVINTSTPPDHSRKVDPKQDALLRFLCHHLIYIGKTASLLVSSTDGVALFRKWKGSWNRPAAFTWNWNTSVFEPCHASKRQTDVFEILDTCQESTTQRSNFDLSDFNDFAEFTLDTDLVRCKTCSGLWSTVDDYGICQMCQPTSSSSWIGNGFQEFDSADNMQTFADSVFPPRPSTLKREGPKPMFQNDVYGNMSDITQTAPTLDDLDANNSLFSDADVEIPFFEDITDYPNLDILQKYLGVIFGDEKIHHHQKTSNNNLDILFDKKQVYCEPAQNFVNDVLKDSIIHRPCARCHPLYTIPLSEDTFQYICGRCQHTQLPTMPTKKPLPVRSRWSHCYRPERYSRGPRHEHGSTLSSIRRLKTHIKDFPYAPFRIGEEIEDSRLDSPSKASCSGQHHRTADNSPITRNIIQKEWETLFRTGNRMDASKAVGEQETRLLI